MSDSDDNPIFCNQGLATSSPHRAKNILIAGIFLLNANACLNGNIQKKSPSALLGSSHHTLKGISNIGVSRVIGSV